MHTLLTDDVEIAARYVRAGDVVAFPTETVYGLGADALQPEAIHRIFEAKKRPADNPLIVHIAGLEQVSLLAESVPEAAQVLMEHFFPGPLTLVLPRHSRVPAVVSAGLPSVGVRMPQHPVAQSFLEACGSPVAAPSANRSGRPSPTTWQAVRADLEGSIPCILKGDQSPVGLESTVVDCTGETPLVLRAGAVTLEALQEVLPETRLAGDDAAMLARSPGTRYRHYAPDAHVVLIDDPEAAFPRARAAYIGLSEPPTPDVFGIARTCEDVMQYSYDLFDFFRRCDTMGIEVIFCQVVPPTGLGLALMDRLKRAADS